jgi:hypothetical protein
MPANQAVLSPLPLFWSGNEGLKDYPFLPEYQQFNDRISPDPKILGKSKLTI